MKTEVNCLFKILPFRLNVFIVYVLSITNVILCPLSSFFYDINRKKKWVIFAFAYTLLILSFALCDFSFYFSSKSNVFIQASNYFFDFCFWKLNLFSLSRFISLVSHFSISCPNLHLACLGI